MVQGGRTVRAFAVGARDLRKCNRGRLFNGIVRCHVATATFTLTESDPSAFEVRWSWWGREQYLYDGRMLQSLWDLTTFTGHRTFTVDGHLVRISWAAKDNFRTRVHVDGNLRVDNLFPQLTLKRRPFSWSKWLKTVVIWMIIGFIVTIAYEYWKSRQRVTPNKALERTMDHRGHVVLAMDGQLADVQWQQWLAAQLNR